MHTIETVTASLTAKHPKYYSLSVKESSHCVIGYSIDAFIETEDEKLHYCVYNAGRLRCVKREKLTLTYKSVRNEPKDSAIIIRGGKYDGHYMVRYEGDGWLKLSTDVVEVQPMRESDAKEFRNYIARHAQYCYRGTFEVVSL